MRNRLLNYQKKQKIQSHNFMKKIKFNLIQNLSHNMRKNCSYRINKQKSLKVKLKDKKYSGNQPKSINQKRAIKRSLKKRKKRNLKVFWMIMINWSPMDIKTQVKLQVNTQKLIRSCLIKLSCFRLTKNQILIGEILFN